MATASVDQATLKRTIDTLSKIIKKPPLTEKLLNRPPFRYIHDIIREISKATGFFDGLYTGAELDAKSFQDKESKIAFLQKTIDVLSFVQGEVVRVRASKIVAGQEAEKTNELLQLLSIAILKKSDSGETKLDRPPSARGHRRHVETGEREEGGDQGRETERGGEEKVLEPTQQSPSPSSPPPTNTTVDPQPHSLGLVSGRRPGSARPAPPRVVQHSSTANDRGVVESSVAPPTVIMDTPGGGDNEDDEDEGTEEGEDKEYVVGDSAPLAPPTSEGPNGLPPVDSASDEPEGMLTKTIVATKERLEGVRGEEGEGALEAVTPAQQRREMELVRKEMERLRGDIQLLCRYTNPMGRVMDYLQEDTDTMIQELERWRTENSGHKESLRREESITENELVPLKTQLEDVELHIEEEREKISSLKATIIRQDDSIRQLMRSIIPHS
ncbi:TRAF3-interacting protein 1 [Geodia barretti]|uniref:TRAF3-interacting protein 1 n=1 Tax=Geodia barretti TaxID=519541 RepID=A0AA35X2Z8_GEOBA|nr:TRAF3-interacting protein 1 [Geodia barretti]